MSGIALRLYGLLMTLAQPFLRRKLARRARLEPAYGEHIEERFGHYSQPVESTSSLVWLHAVSLGETRAAAILLTALRQQFPGVRILLTHGTATGRAEGGVLLQPGDVQVWQAWDSPAAVQRFFRHFKPRLGLLMETEVWPQTLAAAGAEHIPVVLINARLSEKSLQQALRMAPLAYPAYAALTQVFAQTDDDARRFRQLGVAPAGVFGNLKFDATPDAAQLAQGRSWRQSLARPVVLIASSREGEENAFFKQINALAPVQRAQLAIYNVANEGLELLATSAGQAALSPQPRWLLVPRHPQRFDEVAALAAEHGLQVSRRSSWPADGPAGSPAALAADIWLGDSLGEMALYYALGDVALLGGSFEPLGGQNLIEAAACGCPVVMGPHTFNFAEAAGMAEAAGAAQRVANLADGLRAAVSLVASPAAHKAAAAGALAFANRNKGATRRTLAALAVYLG